MQLTVTIASAGSTDLLVVVAGRERGVRRNLPKFLGKPGQVERAHNPLAGRHLRLSAGELAQVSAYLGKFPPTEEIPVFERGECEPVSDVIARLETGGPLVRE